MPNQTPVTQDSAIIRKLASFGALSSTDMTVLSDLHQRRRRYASGREMVRQGHRNRTAYILADGWAVSYILLPDGSRQIVDVRIPGDFLGLGSMLFNKSSQNVEPITTVEASEIQESDLLSAFAATPNLGRALLWAASRDQSMVAGRLTSLGRRQAPERMVHFLLELGVRLRLVGLADKTGYACPLTQYHLADLLGLSPVHVNRVLRDLREAGMVTFQNGHVAFDDLPRMVAFADFDREYLDDKVPAQW
jgi:CRP-like cAMP-binding protein